MSSIFLLISGPGPWSLDAALPSGEKGSETAWSRQQLGVAP